MKTYEHTAGSTRSADTARVSRFLDAASSAGSPVFSVTEHAILELLTEIGADDESVVLAARATRTRSVAELTAALRSADDETTASAPIREIVDRGLTRLDLLSTDQREACLALSIFATDFTLRQATFVLESAGISAPESILDSLIVDHTVLPEAHGENLRFRLPSVYKLAARSKQNTSGRAQARRGLLSWWLQHANELHRGWFSADQKALFATIDANVDSLRVLLTGYSIDELGDLIEVVAYLEPYWSASAQTDVAVKHLEDLLRHHAVSGVPHAFSQQRFLGLWTLAWLSSAFDLDAAESYLLQASNLLPDASVGGEETARLERVRGMCALYRGEPAAAQALFQAALDYDSTSSRDSDIYIDLSFLASAASLAGDQQVAYDYCERAIAMCERHGETWLKNYTLWAFAMTAWRDGDQHRAFVLALDSVEAAAEINDPYAGAIALEIVAWYQASRGDSELAARLLGVADRLRLDVRIPTLFWGTKAPHDAAVREALERLGPEAYRRAFRGAHKSTLSDALSWLQKDAPSDGVTTSGGVLNSTLTPRQREIALLIADGMTNKEIARLLLITVRTVEAHIEHIFAKLKVNSRSQVAVWSARNS